MAKLTAFDLGPVWRGTGYLFYCPGCEHAHVFHVRTDGRRPSWTFDGKMDRPTFSPSLLNTGGPRGENGRCHLSLIDGEIRFYNDCDHALAGRIVDLPEDE